jgi:hypothetical protein
MKSRGFTIYCDDIRSEIGGKTTLVGCYNGLMQIQGAMPVAILKFGIAVHLMIAESEQGIFARPDIELIVYGTSEEVISLTKIDLSNMNSSSIEVNNFSTPILEAQKKLSEEKSEKFLSLNFNFLLSPINFEKEGFIRTRVKIGKKILKIGSLMITANSELPSSI